MKTKNKKIRTALIILIILAVLSPYISEFADISLFGSDTPVKVSIPQGSSAPEIGRILKENHLIRSSGIFLIRIKLSKYKNRLHYGTFEFTKKMTVGEIIRTLGENAFVQETVTVTIPEGSSAEQIAVILEDSGLKGGDEFLSALNDTYDYEFIKDIPAGDYKYALQGFLFPSTYEFFVSASAHDIADKLLSEFERQYKSLRGNKNSNVFEIITKASIIEKEAKLDSERPTVAGVIDNRLSAQMPLQIDACVVYAVSDGMYNISALYENQIKTDSPYNTYKYKGLPAGPICNPGITSIKAALNPEKHGYYYYHTDEEKKDGSHIFTATYDEHLKTMN